MDEAVRENSITGAGDIRSSAQSAEGWWTDDWIGGNVTSAYVVATSPSTTAAVGNQGGSLPGNYSNSTLIPALLTMLRDATVASPTTSTNTSPTTSSSMTTAQSTLAETYAFSEEELFPGGASLGRLPNSSAGHQGRNWAPMGLVGIIVLALLGNLFVCLAIKLDRRLHHMTYYFFVSMATLHILMAAIVMPPAVIVVLAGEFSYSEDMCKLWITLDLFLCNNTCLHLAFCNMDTFLRLKDPLRHGRITTTCSLILWLGASWIISFVQGIAQFMLSQADKGIVRHGVCFISDKNFVILGTLFSFLIPMVISVTFYGLCVHELRVLRDGRFVDESEASTQNNAYHYGSNESIPEDISDSTSCASDTAVEVQQQPPREQVQLAVVTNFKEGGEIKGCLSTASQRQEEETTTSFCTNLDPSDRNSLKPEPGHSNLAFADHLLSTDQSASCTLLLRNQAPAEAPDLVTLRSNAEHDHSSPDESLHQELALSRLMFLLLIFALTLWIPFSASNIVYGVCEHCRVNMTFDEIMTFKWLSYSSAVIGPMVYLKFSEQIREALWSMVTCRYCKWQH